MNALAYMPLAPDEAYSQAYGTVSAMQSRILRPEDLEPPALAGDMEEAVAFFDSTVYAQELSSVGEHDDFSVIEMALERHFLRAYGEASCTVPEADRKSLDQVILGEYDLKNLKSILRCVVNSVSPGEIKTMLYFGTIDHALLEKMSQSGGAGDALSIIAGILGDTSGMLDSALTEYQKTHAILSLEMALDRIFVGRWLSIGRLSEYARMRLDVINLINLFRCRIHQTDYWEHVIAEGLFLDERTLKKLGDTPLPEINSHLDATPYGPAVKKAVHEGGGISLPALERSLEDVVEEEVDINAIVNPLSIWPVVRFIKLKQGEVRNVRTVLLLKSQGSTPDAIKKILFKHMP